MKERGAALYLEDSDVTSQSLKKLINSLSENPDYLAQIKQNSLALAHFDGCERIVKQLKAIADV